MLVISTSRFPLGQIVITPSALETLSPSRIEAALARHAQGDWGELDLEDRKANAEALEHGLRLFSAYGQGDDRFWIITEADRSVTTILMPADY